ncbi:MAG TPA: LysM peptidoglycan-binding domain-containing protein [Gammaproteobacteria bacterium]|nr:LysM peptidoglycan-binding domain-containing protein [Gammaproteobacteria bacterium]
MFTSYFSGSCRPAKSLWLCFALLLFTASALAEQELMPRPPEIERDVRFWTRVYTEIDSNQGFIHDDWNLDVVYGTLQFKPDISRHERDRLVEKVKNEYRHILLRLATVKKEELNAEEQRVLGLWPEGTSKEEFRNAARRLRFQLGQSDRFLEGLIRSGRWMPHILETLKQEGLPLELAALPHVESSFNPNAYSFVGAAGMWQFTRSTGRRFMRVDHVIDERMDPFMATVAAAHLLKNNYDTTGSWPLALTAYNHGLSGMRRAIDKTGGTDVVKVLREYRSRSFKFASRNFYVAFLAALEVNRNASKYFGPIELDPPADEIIVEMPDYMPAHAVAKGVGVALEDLRKLNPALRGPIWNGEKYIPRGFKLRLPRKPGANYAGLIAAVTERFNKQLPDQLYTVQRGDSLSQIADRFGVSLTDLMAVNNMSNRHFIRVGQQLHLPRTAAAPAVPALVNGRYRVRQGDSLSAIAERFGVSEEKLLAINALPDRNAINKGQWLRIEGEEAEPQVVVASLDNAAVGTATASAVAPAAAPETGGEKIAIAEMRSADEEPSEEAEPTTSEEETSSIAPVQPAVQVSPLTADPSDYSVGEDSTIEIQAEETLGHYAEWLQVRTDGLRKLNRLRGKPLVIGKRLKLDFTKVTPEIFEQQRITYHRGLQESYFARYLIAGTQEHKIRRGESIWILAERRYNVPIWLLLQYNPDLDLNKVKPGLVVNFPLVQEKTEGG